MATYTLTPHPGADVDNRVTFQALVDGASAGDTVIIPAHATPYTFTSPADPGTGNPYYAIVLKSGTAGNPITYTFNGNLIAAASSFAGVRASFIGCDKKSYITINGSGSIDGTNMPATGEFRHLLQMRGASNITISGSSGLQFLNAKGGDCIIIATTETDLDANHTPCSDVTITDLFTSGARRNNISLLACVDVTLRRVTWTDAAGTPTQAGINCEPEDSAGDQLTRVLIDSCIGYGNASRDFLISLDSMAGSGQQPIDVTLRNCLSRRGTRVTPWGLNLIHTLQPATTGTIKIEGFRAERLNLPAMRIQWRLDSAVKVNITGGHAFECARTTTEFPLDFVLTQSPTGQGVEFKDFAVIDHRDRKVSTVSSSGGDATNVKGAIQLRGPNWPGNSQTQSLLSRLNVAIPSSRKPKARRATRGSY